MTGDYFITCAETPIKNDIIKSITLKANFFSITKKQNSFSSICFHI